MTTVDYESLKEAIENNAGVSRAIIGVFFDSLFDCELGPLPESERFQRLRDGFIAIGGAGEDFDKAVGSITRSNKT